MNRTLNIKNENYYRLEYFNRPIHLQDDYYIDNYEIIELKKENVANLLFKNQTKICFRCELNIEKNEYLMNCGCLYCENCFKTKLKRSTNEYMYINDSWELIGNT
jgi:late competence protein required for DNA uptake (superfamily II DNA/RNA helicase)